MEQVGNLKSQETKLRRGLNIFKIEQPPSKDLQGVEKDLEHLEQVWAVTKEWEELWDSWKVGKFEELVTTDMETTSQLLFKRLNKLIREVKVCNSELSDGSIKLKMPKELQLYYFLNDGYCHNVIFHNKVDLFYIGQKLGDLRLYQISYRAIQTYHAFDPRSKEPSYEGQALGTD